MFRRVTFLLMLVCATAFAQTPDQQAREQAIAEFTKKQQAANWPEKFARIGNEMGVPADVLASVAFAETRWEHLQWPPGESFSPENGAPRGFGIMFLQDNDHFGHSLIEAAQLIGKTPDELKADSELNIRGAAALLKKLYDENAKPDFAKPADIESWYNAIIKYCGIPEDYLSHSHAYHCYVYMGKGYNQYGMYWKAHPVNLAPMAADVAKLRQEFDQAIQQRTMTNAAVAAATNAVVTNATTKIITTNSNQEKPAVVIAKVETHGEQPEFNLWPFLGLGFVVCVIVTLLIGRNKTNKRAPHEEV
jgi:hypothetical protein